MLEEVVVLHNVETIAHRHSLIIQACGGAD